MHLESWGVVRADTARIHWTQTIHNSEARDTLSLTPRSTHKGPLACPFLNPELPCHDLEEHAEALFSLLSSLSSNNLFCAIEGPHYIVLTFNCIDLRSITEICYTDILCNSEFWAFSVPIT